VDALREVLGFEVAFVCILQVLNFLARLLAHGLKHLRTMQVFRTVLRSQLPWQLLRIKVGAKQTSPDRLDLRSLHEEFPGVLWVGLDWFLLGRI
jgi:hypothetical protein